ncbi:uncharacterized protein LOC122552273 isoform X2 [Chiloscyllium plagiosum]|uniref:uncharacterized protein LOC122552273 isoform X2 n=1 Tax=Chiloscyllium plagiosum TaxID=36176 RepID=UPI001CB821A7|nr:uncharacterized protein LOC122552273 isoform X2 [Chiloscyllium plagiosum]
MMHEADIEGPAHLFCRLMCPELSWSTSLERADSAGQVRAMPETMPHEPTYTNFHILRDHRENETIYNNCDIHRQSSGRAGRSQGCGREISCGGWTIILGKSMMLIISFLVMFVLLVVCISRISNVEQKVSPAKTTLKTEHNKDQTINSTFPDEVKLMLENLMTELSKAVNTSMILDAMKLIQEEIMSILNNIQKNASLILDAVKPMQEEIMSELDKIRKNRNFTGQSPEKQRLTKGQCYRFTSKQSDLNKTAEENNGTQSAKQENKPCIEIQCEVTSVNNTDTARCVFHKQLIPRELVCHTMEP